MGAVHQHVEDGIVKRRVTDIRVNLIEAVLYTFLFYNLMAL